MRKEEIHVEPAFQKKEQPKPLSKVDTNAIKAFVNDLTPEEMALTLSLIDSGVLFKELEMRTNQMKFKLDVIKGVVGDDKNN